jgi:dephospho-CoA kinase
LGGIGSGKSFVAGELARHGAVVFDADKVGHQVLELPQVVAAARQRWGPEILDSRGQIDRRALARIVFDPGSATELRYLEEITHPLIAKQFAELMQALSAGQPRSVVVVDAPLLLRAGWDKICDKVVYVDAPYEVRLARAQQRGWSEAEFRRREAAQEDLDLKRASADVTIDNSASPESTQAQVERLWQCLVG